MLCIYNSIFNNFIYKEFAKKDDIANTAIVNKGVDSTVDIVFSDNAGILIKKGEDKNIEQSISINENISAPIQEGQKLGTATYSMNGEVLAGVDLVASKSVEKINLFTMTKSVVYKWIDLLR